MMTINTSRFLRIMLLGFGMAASVPLPAQIVPPPINGRTARPVVQALPNGGQRVTFEYGVRVGEGERHRGYIRAQWDFDPYIQLREGRIVVSLNASQTVLEHQSVNHGLGALDWGYRMMDADDMDDVVKSVTLSRAGQTFTPVPNNKWSFEPLPAGEGELTITVALDHLGAKTTLTFRNPDFRLRFYDPSFSRQISEVALGTSFGVELRLPNDPNPAQIDRTTITLRTRGSKLGPAASQLLELVETAANSSIFRTSRPGVLATFDDESKAVPFVVVMPGDDIQASYLTAIVALPVKPVAPVDDDKTTEDDRAAWRFEWVNNTSELEFEPGAVGAEDALLIRLLDDEGTPIPGVVLRWQFGSTRLEATSLTDDNGVAVLGFALKPTTDFAVLTDGNELIDRSIAAGRHEIRVKVDAPDMDDEVANTPAVGLAVLKKPVVLNFLNRERGGFISNLVSGDSFQLELHDIVTGKTPGEITVALSSTTAQSEATLYRYPQEIDTASYYLSERAITAYDGTGEASSPKIVIPRGTSLTASYKNASVSIPLYETWLDREIAEMDAALDMFQSILDSAATDALSEDALNRVEMRRQLIANARLCLKHPDLLKPHKLYLGAAYMEMLGAPVATESEGGSLELDRSRLSSGRSPAWNDLVLTSEDEADAIYDAIQKARAHTLGSLVAIPGEIATSTYEAVKGIPQMVASPVLSGYTIWTGLTLDGQRATTFEKVMGGVDVVLLVVPFVPFKALARAGGAMKARFVRTALREAEASAATSNIVRAAARERLMGEQAVLDKRVKWKAANEAGIAKSQAAVAGLEEKMAALRREIDDAVRRHGPRKKLRQQLTKLQAESQALKVSIDELIRINRTHKNLIAKKMARIERMKRAELTAEALQKHIANKTLPPARARVNGRSCHWQFEQQINRKLAPEGFTPGERLPERLASPYQPPHSGGMGPDGLKIDLENLKRPVRRPHPDHMNTATFDIADAKYYDFVTKYLTKDSQFSAALTIADTAEKATLYQRWLAKQAFAAGTEEAITQIVLNSRIRIYTPVQMPWDVKNLIRKLVGPRNAPRLEFHVAAPQLAEWAVH